MNHSEVTAIYVTCSDKRYHKSELKILRYWNCIIFCSFLNILIPNLSLYSHYWPRYGRFKLAGVYDNFRETKHFCITSLLCKYQWLHHTHCYRYFQAEFGFNIIWHGRWDPKGVTYAKISKSQNLNILNVLAHSSKVALRLMVPCVRTHHI